MKKRNLIVYLIAFLIVAAGYIHAADLSDIERHKTCKLCGMDRKTYKHSRVLIEYDNGTAQGFCSLHCAAANLAVLLDKTPKSIKVADLESKQLINAESATWVVGGRLRGVMTMQGKWAFATKERAEEFLKENGGKITSFDLAMRYAYQDMYEDTRMARERRHANTAQSRK